VSWGSALETRGLHALTREKVIDGFAMHPEHAAHANGIEPSIVNQPSNRLGMNAELRRDLTDADEPFGFAFYRRHNPH
jgi:hypothetical protein